MERKMRGLIYVTDQTYVEFYRTLVRQNCPKTQLVLCDSIKDARNAMLERHMDFFLADFVVVRNKGMDISGFRFLESVRSVTEYRFTPIFLVTDMADERLFAYNRLHCYCYYQRPLCMNLFREDLIPYLSYLEKNSGKEKREEQVYFFRNRTALYTVSESELVMFKMQTRRGTVYTTDGSFEADVRVLRNCKELTGSDHFVKCNRECYVNPDFIRRVDRDQVVLKRNFGTVRLTECGKKNLERKMKK